jgi:hypothetical protein
LAIKKSIFVLAIASCPDDLDEQLLNPQKICPLDG